MATTDFDNNVSAKESETIIKQGESNTVELTNNEIRSLKSMTEILAKLHSIDKQLEVWTPPTESWKEIDAKRNTLNLLHECVSMLGSTSIFLELKLKGLGAPPSPVVPSKHEPDYSQFLPQIIKIQRAFRNFRIRSRTRRLSNAMSNSVEAQMAPQRTKLHKEIIDTERSYLTSIQLLIKSFKVPFEKANCVSANEVNKIFSNIESIAKCSEQLLERLEEADSMHVGVVFKDLAPYFNIYTLYVNNFEQSNLAFKELQERPQFDTLLKNCTANARKEANRSVDIFDLLIQPVQRIPRYQLLLEAMLKLTPADHVSYTGLQAALLQIKKVADNINEQKRTKDYATKIVEIQASIDDLPFNLVEAHRRFIYEGDMLKLWGEPEEFHFFLFNDLLLFTFKTNAMLLSSWYGQPMLKYVSFLGFEKAQLVDVPDSPDSPRKNAFELQYDMDGKPRSFAFSCPSEKLKQEWMQHLKTQIESRKNPNKITKKDQKMEGYLYKRGGIIKSWKLRYFVLNNAILYYYESKSDFVPLGKIVLERYVVRLSKIHRNAIELHHPTDRSYILYADNSETIKSWIVEFNRICAVENEVMVHYSVRDKAPLSDNAEDWEVIGVKK